MGTRNDGKNDSQYTWQSPRMRMPKTFNNTSGISHKNCHFCFGERVGHPWRSNRNSLTKFNFRKCDHSMDITAAVLLFKLREEVNRTRATIYFIHFRTFQLSILIAIPILFRKSKPIIFNDSERSKQTVPFVWNIIWYEL